MNDISPRIEDELFEFETSASLELEVSDEVHDREELLERLEFQAIELLRHLNLSASEDVGGDQDGFSTKSE